MKLTTGGLIRTLKEALGILLVAYFPGARDCIETTDSENPHKNGTNSINWEKAKKVPTD